MWSSPCQDKVDTLLGSLLALNLQIAKGFETTVVATIEGKMHTGIVKVDNAEILQLLTAEGKLVTIRKDDIDERMSGKSSMPEDLTKHLSQSDIRDLVEFLSSLKPLDDTPRTCGPTITHFR